ncbi:hypothetical protein [Shewanella khirikhana]|uniref:Uncharacterized protein n=1 Tax=Shewanella khirikhana TaxID=1965282 RepID=A0ABM7DPW8_9GAMM|nr:hypothetical protein [Shewanella khirikhana]AZQ11726.1 hypothetical protein STH12_02657 [Shewanella khirikhana]
MDIITCNDRDLPDDLQAIANEASRIAIEGIETAAAHLHEPAKFSLPAKAALENAALQVLKLRQVAKPRQVRALQIRSARKLSGATSHTSVRRDSLATRLRLQPSLVRNGIFSELSAMDTSVKAIKLSSETTAAIKDAVANKDAALLYSRLGMSYSMLSDSKNSAASGSPAAAPVSGFTKLRLNIIKVKCLDDVGLELTDFGEDDIRLGGLGADSTDQRREVAGFRVGNFRKGRAKSFNPPRKFVEFDLTRGGPWPRTFSTTFLMAESDGSGAFLEALRALWDAVHEVVEALVVAAAMAAGGAAGISMGSAGGPVGVLVGAVVGVALGLIAYYLFESLEDDIFEPTTVNLLLPDVNTKFSQGYTSDIRSENLTHPSASYILKYQWELVS